MSSPISTTHGCSGFSRYENHSSWLVVWFDAQESTYHTSSNLGWSSSLNLPRVSSRRLAPFRLFWILAILRRSATTTNFLVRFARIRIRFSPNRHASSSTRSPCGPSCHNTSIPCQPFVKEYMWNLHKYNCVTKDKRQARFNGKLKQQNVHGRDRESRTQRLNSKQYNTLCT